VKKEDNLKFKGGSIKSSFSLDAHNFLDKLQTDMGTDTSISYDTSTGSFRERDDNIASKCGSWWYLTTNKHDQKLFDELKAKCFTIPYNSTAVK
jgi:hypothetical protein